MIDTEVFYNEGLISRDQREKLNGHKSLIVWFTGLSGSGKSSLANALDQQLYDLKYKSFVLDGDNVRYGLSNDLSFSDQDRNENIRRAGEVSKLLMNTGTITLAAFISPFIKDRDFVRKLVPEGDFIEVYCNADFKTCELRDTKGIYRKARTNSIKNFTGISSVYEEPVNPELNIDTTNTAIEYGVDEILKYIKPKLSL